MDERRCVDEFREDWRVRRQLYEPLGTERFFDGYEEKPLDTANGALALEVLLHVRELQSSRLPSYT